MSIEAGISNLKAIAYIILKIIEPRTTPIARFGIPPLPMKVPPIRRLARAIVTIPEPMSIFTDFWD